MTGEAHWLTFMPLILGGLWLAWLRNREANEERRYVLEQRQFRCPRHWRSVVDATVVRDAQSDEAIGVRSCSAFADPESVTCDRACVAQFKPRAAEAQAAAR